MKVRELIEKLQAVDPDLPVLAVTDGYGQWHLASELRVFKAVQVCDADHPAPFGAGGKPRGEWFTAVEIS